MCGLKLYAASLMMAVIGHTLYGCVDWNSLVATTTIPLDGHTLYGCVDWNSLPSVKGVWTARSHPVWVCGFNWGFVNTIAGLYIKSVWIHCSGGNIIEKLARNIENFWCYQIIILSLHRKEQNALKEKWHCCYRQVLLAFYAKADDCYLLILIGSSQILVHLCI